jgi:uncharacterized membrane protein
MDNEKKYLKEEIRKEFQLERMVLFSDAVFAIVITLMAIEIHVPHFEGEVTHEILVDQLFHLIPVFLAYAGSFLFIGNIWYRHLQIFSLLKDYDKGLVFRNLVMLFFVGLFPFSASLIASVANGLYLPVAIYFTVVLACSITQLRLQHYILVKKPHLRINSDIHEELNSYKSTRIVMILLSIVFVLISVTFSLITNPMLKPIAWWWFIPFPFVLRYYQNKLKKK